MVPPLIALLTDFGSQDHYVGAVKGAILSVCPDARLVDIAHDLTSHDVEEGAFALAAAVGAFPPGTVFLAVVDPGVGSNRRGLVVEVGAWRFVGPDNGIFTYVLDEHAGARVHALENRALFRYEVSPTFHARDVFGPAAAHLAQGLKLHYVGPEVADPVRFPLPGLSQSGHWAWQAAVVHVDRFGNLTTSCLRRDLDALTATVGDPSGLVVTVAETVMPLVRTYADVPEGELCALLGSSGRLEIAAHRASAARILGARRGTPVLIRGVSLAPIEG